MTKDDLTVAVVVCTVPTRRKKLTDCVHSILQNTVLPEEIFVVCDDTDNLSLPQPVRVIKTKATGVSEKKNGAIQFAGSDIVAFTDDDCIVSKSWVKTIKKTFCANPTITGLFGPVKSYQPQKNKKLICPSVFYKPKSRMFTSPRIHQDVGSGNNMAFRRETLLQLGGFKPWLGPGSATKSADDAEIIIRSLRSGQTIMYHNSGNVVWHNRWLTPKEYQEQEVDYILADTACYAYYLFACSFAIRRIYKRWTTNIWRYGHSIKLFLKGKIQEGLNSLTYSLKETPVLIKGILLGVFQRIRAT
jgi:glycosyltransferase involved in cell wall biosynthesis